MKPTSILASIAIFLVATIANAEDDSTLQMWRTLSARSQNLHNELLIIGRDTAPDPSMHEESLKGIDDALSKLVSAGELVSKNIKIKSPDEAGEETFEDLFEFVHKLGADYGFFVASEMCDLGARLRFMTFMPEDPIALHLRLPQKDMDAFIDLAKSFELLKE